LILRKGLSIGGTQPTQGFRQGWNGFGREAGENPLESIATINRTMKFALLLVSLLLCLAHTPAFAEDPSAARVKTPEPTLEQRTKFKNVEDLLKLIEKAREAGISDEELKKLDLNNEEGQVSVLEYIEEFKKVKRLKDQELQDFMEKRFLTVGDIFKELVDMEPSKLKTLREELVSEY